MRDLFTFHEDETCLTHSLLNCDCTTSSTSTTSAHGRSVMSGTRNQGKRARFLDEPSAAQVKELLKEWTHIEVDSWRRMVRQLGKDPIEPEVFVRDRILWNVLTSRASTKQQAATESDQEDVDESDEGDDDQDVKVEGGRTHEGSVVSFVFLRSATADAAAPSLKAPIDLATAVNT